MPSLNRPNAPNRLPSEDFGDLFFKPHAQRVNEARSSVTTPSPLSSPINPFTQRRAFRSSDADLPTPSSPLGSPRVFTPQWRRPYAERSNYRSESSVKSGSSQDIARDSSGSPYAIEEESVPSKARRSSISDKARERLALSDIDHPTLSSSVEQAPRNAKVGFQWKRDFLGGWLEVRVGRHSEPDDTVSRADSALGGPSLRAGITTPRRGSDTLTVAKSRSLSTDERLLPKTPDDFDTISALGPLQEGLYCRTKRALGLKHGPIIPYRGSRTRTPTGAVLDRVTSTLRYFPSRALSASTSAATSVSDLSIAAPRKQRHSRRNEMYSSSSSVRDLLMGRVPAGTPEPEAMYTGSDSTKYLTVDMTLSDAPAFLPSEARRINTPPLPSEGSAKRGLRGFFFDYEPPSEEPQTSALEQQESPPTNAHETKSRSTEKDWYRIQLDAIDQKDIATRGDFVASVPEHLPNSPLCPRNPKHQSGGTGVCPYHGRNRSTPSEVEKTPTPGTAGKLSPVLETWWMQ